MGCATSREATQTIKNPKVVKKEEKVPEVKKEKVPEIKQEIKPKRIKGKPSKYKPAHKTGKDLIEIIYYGVLADNSNFENCLITSQNEMLTKLKYKIVTQLVELVEDSKVMGKKPNVKYVPNLQDDILTLPNLIDFGQFSVIVIKGANIEQVILKNGSYSVKVSDEPANDNEYCAAVVSRTNNPPFSWEFENPPENHFVEQRPMNENLMIEQRPMNYN